MTHYYTACSCGGTRKTTAKQCRACFEASCAPSYRQSWGGCHEWTGNIGNGGYGRAKMPDERMALVHVETWKAYHGPIPEGLYVCHKCDNPRCFLIDHLWLGTPKENTQDAVAKGRNAFGERAGNAKLTDDDVREIRRRYVSGIGGNRAALAAEFGVSGESIYCVAAGHTWRHVA